VISEAKATEKAHVTTSGNTPTHKNTESSPKDPEEFKELHSAVAEEWSPAGTTEEEAVFTIATAMWRKRRAHDFLKFQLSRNLFDISHPAFDATIGMLVLVGALQKQPEPAFDMYASRFLRPSKINYLNQKFSRSNFKSTSKWAQAVIDEIRLVEPTPNYREYEVPEELRELLGEGPEVWKKMAAIQPSLRSSDLFMQELALNERLDAMIDRAIKRLIQIKAMKQMPAKPARSE
jgi:hypothetical protein